MRSVAERASELGVLLVDYSKLGSAHAINTLLDLFSISILLLYNILCPLCQSPRIVTCKLNEPATGYSKILQLIIEPELSFYITTV